MSMLDGFDTYLITGLIGEMAEAIIRVMSVNDAATRSILGSVNNDLSDKIQASQDAILVAMQDMELGTDIDVAGLLDESQTAQTNALTSVISNIARVQESNSVLLAEQTDRIDGAMAGVQTILSEITDFVAGGLNTTIENIINVPELIFDDAERVLGVYMEGVQAVIDQDRETLRKVLEDIAATDDAVLEAIVEGLPDELGHIGVAIKEIAEAVKGNGAIAEKIAEGDFIGAAVEAAGSVFDPAMGVISDDLQSAYTNLMSFDTENLDNLCKWYSGDNVYQSDYPLVDGIVKGLIFVFQFMVIPSMISQQRGQLCLQEDALDIPWQLIPEGDVIKALHRQVIDNDTAIEELRRAGYSRERITTLIANADTIPAIEFLFSAWFRGDLTTDGLDYELGAMGFTETRRDYLKEVAIYIPPIQDLITMAVKDAFKPNAIRLGRLDEDFPEEMGKWAEKLGVTKDWSEKYWIAHWSLPSPQMAFEMFQRGFLEPEELDTLLAALDIAPGYRDKLKAIAYNPITRVDIRRMNSIGLLEGEPLIKAYKNIGYSPEDAAALAEFTEQLNDPDDLVTLDVASDLTRSNIIQFYTRGILSRTAAYALLLQAGINVAAAELFLQNADMSQELKERQDNIDLVMDRFKVEEITFTEAADQLRALGLETPELQSALLELERLRIGKVKQPTRADMDKFLKAGLVGPEEYLAFLERSGYERQWAERYLVMNTGGQIVNA